MRTCVCSTTTTKKPTIEKYVAHYFSLRYNRHRTVLVCHSRTVPSFAWTVVWLGVRAIEVALPVRSWYYDIVWLDSVQESGWGWTYRLRVVTLSGFKWRLRNSERLTDCCIGRRSRTRWRLFVRLNKASHASSRIIIKSANTNYSHHGRPGNHAFDHLDLHRVMCS